MEELLMVLLQALFEIGAEVLLSLPWDLFSYGYEKDENNYTFLKCFCLLLLGICLGKLSLLFLPKVLIGFPKVRIFNLIAGPFVSGYASFMLARRRIHRGDEDVMPWRHFWYSFSACLGVVMFRFAFGLR